MKVIEQSYSFQETEKRLQDFWDKNKFWENDVNSEKEPFCVMMPPPNITGSLHMGHALDNVLIDIIVRYKRMCGYDVLWQPGTDHASIATQLMVEKDLTKRGINPRSLSKEELLQHAYKWKDEKGGEIIKQLHILGVTPAWSRERFTMDKGLSEAVTKLFVKMYDDGLIYKAERLVNWCPKQMTTISDLEVNTKEEKGKFYYFKYPLDNGDYVEVATTRPETIFGDKAIAIHPDNSSLKNLIGKTAVIPFSGIRIPVIADVHADPQKGTGAVKITPAHDVEDWNVAKRHNLKHLTIFSQNARLLAIPEVPEKYRGLSRFDARKQIVEDLQQAGLLVKVEEKIIPVPYSERGNTTIEYMVRDEWFVDAPTLAERAKMVAQNGEIKFLPAHRLNLYMSWMNNIREWSISRQLWWGHQIPAWYDIKGNVYVAENEEKAQKKAGTQNLTRDQSCLDTWFSSALWPFSTLGWPQKTPELKKYYPNNVLYTGTDILFFWAARMIMMGLYVMDDVPFKTANIHGLIRDAKGQKMSKTKGNGVDPLDTIGKYGVDALRYWISTAPIGTDLRYNEADVKRGSKLLIKLWNSARFITMNLTDFDSKKLDEKNITVTEDKWIMSELNKTVAKTRKLLDQYDTFNSRAAIDEFFFGEFCDKYLETIKDRLWNVSKYTPESKQSAQTTLYVALREILGLYAPFIPYITEDLYQKIYANPQMTLHTTAYPTQTSQRDGSFQDIGQVFDVIKEVRNIRTERKISNATRLQSLTVPKNVPSKYYDMLRSGLRTEQVCIGDKVDVMPDISSAQGQLLQANNLAVKIR